MKVKKILIVILMIGCIIGGMIGTVKADTSTTFKANLTANKTSIKAGEEITVTIGVSDINMGENGINTLEGKINYDTNIFEAITTDRPYHRGFSIESAIKMLRDIPDCDEEVIDILLTSQELERD